MWIDRFAGAPELTRKECVGTRRRREIQGVDCVSEGEADEVVLYEVTVRAELVHKLRVEARVFSALVGEIPSTELGTVVTGDGDPVDDSVRNYHYAKRGKVEQN